MGTYLNLWKIWTTQGCPYFECAPYHKVQSKGCNERFTRMFNISKYIQQTEYPERKHEKAATEFSARFPCATALAERFAYIINLIFAYAINFYVLFFYAVAFWGSRFIVYKFDGCHLWFFLFFIWVKKMIYATFSQKIKTVYTRGVWYGFCYMQR